MDSHSFRIMSAELAALLDGARLEKIHAPRPGVFTFIVFAAGRKRHLVFRHERQFPLLFFSDRRLDNPARPSAAVMRLRKYCGGRRISRAVIDYAGRSMGFPVLTAPDEAPCWLLLDMVHGAFVVRELPRNFGAPPSWPDLSLVDALCNVDWKKGGAEEGVWQEFSVLTPLLRETLASLERLDGRALMVDLEAGGGDLFLYSDRNDRPAFYSAWPLPDDVREKRGLTPYSEDLLQTLRAEAGPVLTAVALVDEPRFFSELGRAVYKETSAPERKSSKKQSRLLAKLDQEEKRLEKMLALREDAIALQAVLWRYPAEAKPDVVEVGDGQSGPVRNIALNSLMTLRENMARMFKESARGARGLAMLRERRAQVLSEPVAVRPEGEQGAGGPKKQRNETEHKNREPGTRALVEETGGETKNVARFRSSDGFTLLRGKNAKGNHSLLKLGKSHDLWMHAEDGPSAHLVIRRSHAAEDVPERTLHEAAALVGEKSWQRNDARARVMVALLRHVHAIKGAAPGTVKVDSVLQSITISLEAESRNASGEVEAARRILLKPIESQADLRSPHEDLAAQSLYPRAPDQANRNRQQSHIVHNETGCNNSE